MPHRAVDDGTADPALRLLLDRTAIGDVVLRYAQGLDRRRFDLVRECFTPDAQATYSGVALEAGVEHIVAHVSRIANTQATTHFMGPSLIELDPTTPDEADVLTPAIVYIALVEDGVEVVRTRGLRYQDRFVRDGDRWLISRRVHTADWMYESPGRPTAMAPIPPPIGAAAPPTGVQAPPDQGQAGRE